MKKVEIIKEIDDCELCPYFRWNDNSYNYPGSCSRLHRDLKIERPDDIFYIPRDCPLPEA